jgi:uncharacterized protein YraI
VYHRNIFLFIVTITLCASCGVNIGGESIFTATPDFVTAVLPPTRIPPAPTGRFATQTSIPPTAVPTIPPIEGTTTTQVNVRAEPSTASESLDMIGAFVKVQVIGKDASGSWYQIIYAGSETGNGWIRAEYVQVNVTAEIPLVGTSAGSGSAVSGLVIQKINIRNGPGTEYELLGVLNPNDVVFITGKDPSGAWMQIEFASAPKGTGWVASEFLQVSDPDSLPVIGDVVEIGTPASIPLTPTISQSPARQDGDSMLSPFAVVIFSPSGARTLQVKGDVSAPDGDTEDWVQLTSFTASILAKVECSNSALRVELWNNGHSADDFALACGERRVIKIESTESYFFRIQASSSNNSQYIQYSLKVSAVE